MAKLKIVRGWTLLRREADWKQWDKEQQGDYKTPAPCFPCFARERMRSDESTEYEYLTDGMMADMQAALKEQWNTK